MSMKVSRTMRVVFFGSVSIMVCLLRKKSVPTLIMSISPFQGTKFAKIFFIMNYFSDLVVCFRMIRRIR